MRIGITFNVRGAGGAQPPAAAPSGAAPFAATPSDAGALALPGDDADEEFDAPETIAAVAETLESLGHEVELLGYGEPLLSRLVSGPRPDLVWNIAEGHGRGRCREARVPAVLEMLDVPYTGSDPLTLSATLDKACAKRLVADHGVATPAWALYEGDWPAVAGSVARLAMPVFVKPAQEGSSKGILSGSVVHSERELRAALEQLYDAYRQPILVEEFIDGDELTVGLVGNDPPDVLGVMRVLPSEEHTGPFVYSLEVKRDWRRLARYECPARLAPRDDEAVRRAALAAWRGLGCRDVARFDFRLRRGVPYFLEVNPLPGMSPVSGDLVLLAGGVGIEYRELVARVLGAACDRLHLCGARRLAPMT